MARKRKPVNPTLKASDYRTCETCNVPICLTNGGEFNWNRHIQSEDHKKKATSLKSTKKLTGFFSKAPTNLPSVPLATGVQQCLRTTFVT